MTQKHLLRMAGRIRKHLSSQPTTADTQREGAATELISRLHRMERHWRLARQAIARGWHAASAANERDMLAEASRIEFAAGSLVANLPHSPAANHMPTLGNIIAELRQLEDEFEDVEIDLHLGVISVNIAPIVLEDVELGPFTINLHVGRLADRPCSNCFTCVALTPNPAAASASTTHPHVQDGHLCAGDATTPIAAALKSGRIADAFVLIRSVLQTYNDSSPYVALENWSGRSCSECSDVVDSEQLYLCDGCENDVCGECYCGCDICDKSFCRSCLERDTVSGNRCCSDCRRTCGECDRTVDEESFDEETGLCPACLTHQQSNIEQENDNELATELATTPASAPATAVPAAA